MVEHYMHIAALAYTTGRRIDCRRRFPPDALFPGQRVVVTRNGKEQGEGEIKKAHNSYFKSPAEHYTVQIGNQTLSDISRQDITHVPARKETSSFLTFLPGYAEDSGSYTEIAAEIAAERRGKPQLIELRYGEVRSFNIGWRRETNAALSAWHAAARPRFKVHLREDDVALHYRAGDLLVHAMEHFRLIKYSWFVKHLPRNARRVLILGQYEAGLAFQDESFAAGGRWEATRVAPEVARAYEAEGRSGLASGMYARSRERIRGEIYRHATAVYVHLARFIQRARPDVEVVFASTGVNEDFYLMVHAPWFIGSGSRFSLAAAMMRSGNTTLPIAPFVLQAWVFCDLNFTGITWDAAPQAVQNPMTDGRMSLGEAVHQLATTEPADTTDSQRWCACAPRWQPPPAKIVCALHKQGRKGGRAGVYR
eukprot:g1729.t1